MLIPTKPQFLYWDSDWETIFLNATALTNSCPIEIFEDKYWEQIVGNKPAETRLSGMIVKRGLCDGDRLEVKIQSGRIDWRFMVNRQDPDVLPQSTVGPPYYASSVFADVVDCWLNMCPGITRLGFAAELVNNVDSKSMEYDEILRHVRGLNRHVASMSNSRIRIEKKKMSTHRPDMMINRTSQWSVVKRESVRFSIGTGISTNEPDQYACKLELDINTVNSSKVISKNDISPLFKELVDIGWEIIDKGDSV